MSLADKFGAAATPPACWGPAGLPDAADQLRGARIWGKMIMFFPCFFRQGIPRGQCQLSRVQRHKLYYYVPSEEKPT